MRFDRDRLIFMALSILDDACWRAQNGQVPATMSVRLALACLYSLGRAEKALFDEFWREMRDPQQGAYSANMGNTLRASNLTRCFAGIARSVGVALSIDYCDRLAKVRRGSRQRSH